MAVHPEDARYTMLHGKSLRHPLVPDGRLIPVVADAGVDRAFGTGAVKITPAHDQFDFDLALNHKLPLIVMLDEKGFIAKGLGKYSGTLHSLTAFWIQLL